MDLLKVEESLKQVITDALDATPDIRDKKKSLVYDKQIRVGGIPRTLNIDRVTVGFELNGQDDPQFVRGSLRSMSYTVVIAAPQRELAFYSAGAVISVLDSINWPTVVGQELTDIGGIKAKAVVLNVVVED